MNVIEFDNQLHIWYNENRYGFVKNQLFKCVVLFSDENMKLNEISIHEFNRREDQK